MGKLWVLSCLFRKIYIALYNITIKICLYMFHCIPFIFYLYTVFLILHRLSTNKSVFFITRITYLIKCFIYIEISCFVFNCIKWIYKNVITWIYRSNQYSLYIKYLLIIDRLISIKFILEISAIWHRFF